MIRKTLTIALFVGLTSVGLSAIAPPDAAAQSRAHAGKRTTKKKTVKKRKTTKRTTRRSRGRSTHRHRSGVDVRIHVGTHHDRHRHYRSHGYHGHYRHHVPRYYYYRNTTVIRPRQQVIIVEGNDPSYVPPQLGCPIRTDEARLGLEQWCETAMGNRHGPYRRWYDDGTLAVEGEYQYDLKQGVWVEFHPNGAVRSEGEYDDGEKVGLWTTWGADGEELVAVEY